MQTIDATRAQRAREIYDAALSQPDDSAEWKALEIEQATLSPLRRTNCGVKFSNTPHPQSAYADLPMRGLGLKGGCGLRLDSPTRTTPQLIAEKKRAIALWRNVA